MGLRLRLGLGLRLTLPLGLALRLAVAQGAACLGFGLGKPYLSRNPMEWWGVGCWGQLPDRVIVYELNHDDAFDMHYRVSHKIQKQLTCNLLVVTTRHVILCQEKNLQLYGFDGAKVS